MKMDGKILFFNENDGKGIIITSQREKIEFYVKEWDDFDVMPSLGLEVDFNLENGEALGIISKSTLQTSEHNVEEQIQSDQDFETKDDIDIIDDLEEDLGEQRESISITLNLSLAVANYFNVINEHIQRRQNYKNVNRRLDYILIRRFLWTTFNNLSEIDLAIVTPKIKMLSDDLKVMSKVYDDFNIKIKYPYLAYEEVFLSCQAEYMKIKEGAERTIEKLKLLRTNEERIGGMLQVRKEELDKNIRSEEFDAFKQELKSLNGAYVDVVHMMAELDERYKHDMKLLTDFEQEFRSDFYKLFNAEAVKHKRDLLEILAAQAFIVDSQLWQQAKVSKAVKAYFKKSSIEGELNTKTYLKYFLESIDSTKATGETLKLFELYEYLLTVQKDYILIIVSSAQDAMEFESSVKGINKSYSVKSFIDEKSALKWAMHNSVKILLIEDILQNVSAEKFLSVYQKNILSTPKIILLGNKPKIDSYSISKLLSKGVSSRVVANSVKSLIED